MAKAKQNAEAARGMPGAQQWNPFTTHPHRQGISYVEHWRFAMGIAFRLLTSVFTFALHAILPFLPIARRNDRGPCRPTPTPHPSSAATP